MAESTSPSASLNWNPRIQEDAIQHFHLTDFVLTTLSGELQSILLPTSSDDSTQYVLRGNLVSPHNRSIRVPHTVRVSTYCIDVGMSLETEDVVNQGFWMTGDDSDMRFKLEYPAAPEYADYATGILHLARERRLFRNYEFPYDSGTCFHMTNFILTDQALGIPHTLILPQTGKKVFVLTGRVQLNVTDMQEDEQIELSAYGNYEQLCIRTYVTTKYLVDFGRDTEPKEPQIWMQDNHHSWIKLVGPCHRDYRLDYDTTMRQTINNVAGYNWKSEDEQIWRHVTNFKLTDEAGALHPLEISRLNRVFILWGDLCAPPGSTCPTIPIKVCVKLFSIDMGHTTGDPHQGIWMRGMQTTESWYKLLAPAAPEYRSFADPVFYKTDKYLQFYDALVFQDCSVDLNYTRDYEDEEGNTKYYCVWPVEKIYREANPKFDLNWVKNNGDFILDYLDLDLEKSPVLIQSLIPPHIEDDQRRLTAPPTPVRQIDSAPVVTATSSTAAATATSSSAASTGNLVPAKNVAKETKKVNAEPKKKEKVVVKEKLKAPETKEKKRPLDTTAEDLAREAAAAKARKVASVLNAAGSSSSSSSTAAASSSSAAAPMSSSFSAAAASVVNTAPVTAKPIKKKQILELDSPEVVAAAPSQAVASRAPLLERSDSNGKASLNKAKENSTVTPRSNAVSSTATLPQPAASNRTIVPVATSAGHPTSNSASSNSHANPPDRHSLDRAPEAVGQKRDRSGSYDAVDGRDEPNKYRAVAAPFDDRGRDRDWERDRDRVRPSDPPAWRDESVDRWDGSRDRQDAHDRWNPNNARSFGSREGDRWNDTHYASDRPLGGHRADPFGRDPRSTGGHLETDRDRDRRSDSRERSEDRSGAVRSDLTQAAFLCRYCRTLSKSSKCKISRHIDGKYMPDEHSAIACHLPDARTETGTNIGTPCSYCKTTRKRPACFNVRHVDGKLIPPDTTTFYGPHAANPRDAPYSANNATYASRSAVAEGSSTNHAASHTSGSSWDSVLVDGASAWAPRSTQSVPTPSSPPRDNAAVSGGTVTGLRLAVPGVDISAVRPQFSPVGASSPTGGDDKEGSKRWEKVNEMDVERSSYQKRHLFHTQEQSALQGMLATSAESTDYLQRLQAVNSKPTAVKWGVGLKLPPSKPLPTAPSAGGKASASDPAAQHAPAGVEVVRLGNRETDPKRRLAMTNMNSGGVYTAVVSTASSGGISPRGAVVGGFDGPTVPVFEPFDRTLKPVKSNLRDSTKPKKDGIKWRDVTGGELKTVHMFEKVAYVEECTASNSSAGPTEGGNENGVNNIVP